MSNSSTLPDLVGVDAALRAASDPSFTPRATLFNEFSLQGRVVVVTGGGRGLGLEMAEALAEAGATVYCLAKSVSPTDTWNATQKYVSRIGLGENVRLEYVSVDVTNQKAIWSAFEEIAEKEGRLDVCVASAGTTGVVSSLEETAEHFGNLVCVNVNGLYYTAQAAARQMKRLGSSGSIVLVTSVAGHVGSPDAPSTAYCSTKASGIQMARSLACELSPFRIRVNSLSPGYILTDINKAYIEAHPEAEKSWAAQQPLNRFGKRSELRGVIAWLASDASSYCTGSDIVVDGGHCAW